MRLVDEILNDTRTQATDAEGKPPLAPLTQEIKLEDVWFVYPNTDRRVLDHVDLTIRAGDYVMLAGGSGSGKSTLLSVLMRQRDLSSYGGGTYSFDGVNVEQASLRSFLGQTGVVFQGSMILFGVSIAENIAFGTHADRAAVEEVISPTCR